MARLRMEKNSLNNHYTHLSEQTRGEETNFKVFTDAHLPCVKCSILSSAKKTTWLCVYMWIFDNFLEPSRLFEGAFASVTLSMARGQGSSKERLLSLGSWRNIFSILSCHCSRERERSSRGKGCGRLKVALSGVLKSTNLCFSLSFALIKT